MNNSDLYHAFVVGFNWWMIVFPVELVLMFIYGTQFKWHMGRRTWKISEIDKGDKRMMFFAVLMDVIFMVLLVVESFLGILQYCLNHLGGSDPIYGVFMMAIVLITIMLFAGALLFLSGRAGGGIKHRLLVAKKRRHRML